MRHHANTRRRMGLCCYSVAYRSNRAVPIEPILIVSAVPSIVFRATLTTTSPLKMFQYRGILAKVSQTLHLTSTSSAILLLIPNSMIPSCTFEPSSNLVDVGWEYLKKRDIIQVNSEEKFYPSFANFSALKSSVTFVLIRGLEWLRIR